MRQLLALLVAGPWSFGCGDGQVSEGATADVPSWYTPSDATAATPPAVNPDCKFDSAKLGKRVGDHIANVATKDAYGATYSLHQTCGTNTKAIWAILVAGW